MLFSRSCLLRKYDSFVGRRRTQSIIYGGEVKLVTSSTVRSCRLSRWLGGQSIVERYDWLPWCRRDGHPAHACHSVCVETELPVPSLEVHRYYDTFVIRCSSNFHYRSQRILSNHITRPCGSAFTVCSQARSQEGAPGNWFDYSAYIPCFLYIIYHVGE